MENYYNHGSRLKTFQGQAAVQQVYSLEMYCDFDIKKVKWVELIYSTW